MQKVFNETTFNPNILTIVVGICVIYDEGHCHYQWSLMGQNKQWKRLISTYIISLLNIEKFPNSKPYINNSYANTLDEQEVIIESMCFMHLLVIRIREISQENIYTYFLSSLYPSTGKFYLYCLIPCAGHYYFKFKSM